MSRRFDGYVTDTEYADFWFPVLSPERLSFASVMHGQPPLELDLPLTLMELGSGTGMTAAMIAAGNPKIEVWGCDVNPAHIERSRDLARQAELPNLSFEHCSFADLATNPAIGPDTVDVIVCYGVYSWISPENQHHIAEIIHHRLRPGGIVCLSYVTMTGWSSMVPIAEAMRLQAAASDTTIDRAVSGAFESVARMESGGARCFPLGGTEHRTLVSSQTADHRVSTHEYLGDHLRPLAADEVIDAMARAGCSPVGSAYPSAQPAALCAPPQLVDLLEQTHDVALGELLRDLITQRGLRVDLFRRGLAPGATQATPGVDRELRTGGAERARSGAADGRGPDGHLSARRRTARGARDAASERSRADRGTLVTVAGGAAGGTRGLRRAGGRRRARPSAMEGFTVGAW